MSVSWGRYGGAVGVRFGFGVGIVTVVVVGVVVVSGLELLLSVGFVSVVTVDGLAVDVVVVVVDCRDCVDDAVAYTCVGLAEVVLVWVLRVFGRTLQGLYSQNLSGSGTSLSS